MNQGQVRMSYRDMKRTPRAVLDYLGLVATVSADRAEKGRRDA